MTDLPGGQPHLAPVLEIGGTHVTGALADLFSGTIVPGTAAVKATWCWK